METILNSGELPQPNTREVVRRASAQLEEYLNLSKDSDVDERVLRDRQVAVMEDLYEFISTHPNDLHGYISLPTGVGKTVLFTEFAKATGLRTLVLTPTKILLSQTDQAFNKFGDDEVAVGRIYGGEKNDREDITITTYASFVRQANLSNGLIKPGQYDLLILDEAHRALAAQTKRTLKDFGSAIQIGFTATEDYSESRKLSEILPNVIHKMSIREAIESHLITPFSNIVVETGVDASKIRITKTNEYDSGDLDRVLNSETRNALAVDLYKDYFQGRKVAIFCNGVEHAIDVAEAFKAAGISAGAIHGRLSTRDQESIKHKFKDKSSNGLDVIANDRILMEGFDEPGIIAIFNLSPTLSRVRAQQRGGRALRLDPDYPDKVAFVVDFIDHDFAKPPVIFADPKVAGEAQIGDMIPSLFEQASFLPIETLHGVRLLTDKTQVESLAQSFSKEREGQYEYAPEGWLTAAQINALYGINRADIKEGMKKFTQKVYVVSGEKNEREAEDYRSDFGTYHTNYGINKVKLEHYSPRLVQELAKLEGLEYIDLNEGFPDGWKTREQFHKEYPTRILNSLFMYLNRFHSGAATNNLIINNDVEYFGPAIQDVFRNYDKPPYSWKPLTELGEKINMSDSQLEDLYQDISRSFKWPDRQPPGWHIDSDGNEIAYVSMVAYGQLEREIARRIMFAHRYGDVPTPEEAIKEPLPSLAELFGYKGSSIDPKDVAARAIYNAANAKTVYAQDFSNAKS